MDINLFEKNRFSINEALHNKPNVALISLRSSLISYFETYNAVASSFRGIVSHNNDLAPYGIPYIEKCYQSITFFHHFVELVIKDILSRTHPLLAIDASSKHSIYYDLIFQNKVDESKLDSLYQINFSEALSRLVELLKEDKLDVTKYGFIKEAENFLKKLNKLRNSFTHRGVLVLKYEALDYFFCEYALPFLKKISELPEYNQTYVWKYQILNCGIDPIDELIKLYGVKNLNYDPEKTALLKQLACASYRNPLYMYHPSKNKASNSVVENYMTQFNKEDINRATAISKYVEENDNVHDTEICPVCGTKALVLFKDTVDIEDNSEAESIYYEYVYRVQCFCCHFELRDDIKDISNMDLPIKDFWSTS